MTFFKASERLKTGAVVPLIIYSQKIACEEHIFKERLAQNKITSCECLRRLHYTYHINGPLLNTEIAPRRFFLPFSFSVCPLCFGTILHAAASSGISLC